MKVVTIANANIQIVEYKEERVMTTDQLAQAYECEPNNIKKNFNSNKERFEEGKHYFKLEGAELQNLRVTFSDLQISPMTRTLYLWTRRGASRHCKMLGTDKAWEMFDALEENYFNPQQKPMTQLDILKQNIEILQEQERRLANVEMDIKDTKKSIDNFNQRVNDLNGVCTEGTKRQRLVAMINAYARKAGITYDRAWRDFKNAYNTAYHTNLSLSRRHYMEANNLKKKPSVPEFLEAKGLLDDAMRIADKLLNGELVA